MISNILMIQCCVSSKKKTKYFEGAVTKEFCYSPLHIILILLCGFFFSK